MTLQSEDKVLGAVAEVHLAVRTKGIAAGTVVATLDGYMPVDFLSPGDRIVTRSGARVIRAIQVQRFTGSAVRIGASALGHDRPEQDLTLPSDTLVLVRDWRAKAIFGQEQALVPVERLVDGEYVVHEKVTGMRLYEMIFDTPQIVYAEGVELFCDGVAEDASAEHAAIDRL